ncbi:FHA domain-containing protein [Bifidobacterium sp. ESL0784]|uniref:FHA domain-containing protein n=1 Tax=Bifidobacterium sp. ESL0784 TaxID=2983231 RepID=UPI0023F6B166|nr:FHA domain-containing protein [Bifidobacterium sp. ESL0784]MDF7640383.1 FHA domain-containing protein [Bifidobacterium sp. ESL0784]
MSTLPFPPPPELGWYDDDATVVSANQTSADWSAKDPGTAQTPQTIVDSTAATSRPAVDDSWTSSAPQTNSEGDIEDWDGTVLSSAFMGKKPMKRYRLHNDATGQDIELTKSALLGRNVSATVPQGAMSIKLADPTRTVSRNHAAVSYDKDGTLWIEDYGSLNGTYIVEDDHEQQVKDSPVLLKAPTTLRIGDQFFKLTEVED